MPSQPFVGEIFAAGYNFAPQGYASCSGQLLSIEQNTALFSLLGTTYGGDGQTTFQLPDLRGRVSFTFGQGLGLSPYNLGDTGGQESVTLTQNQMPSHSHQVNGSSANGSSASPAGAAWAKSSEADKVYGAPNGATLNSGALSPTGGSQPHENRQPFLVLNYYIALVGVYPTRD